MSTTSRRRWSAEEKLAILEEGRQSGHSISEVCHRHQIAPGQFYAWERQARQGALAALRHNRNGRKPPDPSELLKAHIQQLQAVIAELTTENLHLKKGRWP
jgi:transposase